MSLMSIMLALFAVAACSSMSLRALVTSTAEYIKALVLTTMYNCGYHFQHFSVIKSSCKVPGDLEEYDEPLSEFLTKFDGKAPQRVSATAAIFRNVGRVDREPEILLLQTKSWPLGRGGYWEMAGGAVDWYPRETVLHAAERELREEAGLNLKSFDKYVGEYRFQAPWMPWTSDNLKIMFIGGVKDGDDDELHSIKLNPMEHQAFCWATKERLGAMASRKSEPVSLKMDGWQAKPKDGQWARMPYISQDGKMLALRAFDMIWAAAGEGKK